MKFHSRAIEAPHIYIRRALLGLSAMLIAGAMLGAGAGSAFGQGIGTSFEGYKDSAGKPISIEADVLEVDDKEKTAVFRGNVVARQGGFSLQAKELLVHYRGSAGEGITRGDKKEAKPASAKPAEGQQQGDSRITRIEAKGKVLVTTRDDQTATSEWANFDVEKQLVTIGGSVVLSQGTNVLRGDRLVIDLVSGKSRFEVKGESGKQRIRGLFQPKRD